MARRLTDPERKLWKHVTRHVRPAPGREIEPDDEEAPAARSTTAQPSPSNTSKTPQKTPSRDPPAGPPADISTQRRIRRGQTDIEARLDLHGHTQDAARRELCRFLVSEQASGSRCVLVITGKGRLGTGILRARFLDWLAEDPIRPLISGYSRAHTRHGGEGAFYVLLKAKRKP